jgi:putative tricarboxylic transport membrane protein
VNKFSVEIIAALGVLALSGMGLLEAWSYSGEGGLMPRGVMIAGMVLSGTWLVESIASLRYGRQSPAGGAPIPKGAAVMLLGAGLALLLGIQFVGFFTSAAVVVPVLAMGLGYRRPLGLLIGTVLFVVLLIAVFRLLLGVPLPPEILLSLLGI